MYFKTFPPTARDTGSLSGLLACLPFIPYQVRGTANDESRSLVSWEKSGSSARHLCLRGPVELREYISGLYTYRPIVEILAG